MMKSGLTALLAALCITVLFSSAALAGKIVVTNNTDKCYRIEVISYFFNPNYMDWSLEQNHQFNVKPGKTGSYDNVLGSFQWIRYFAMPDCPSNVPMGKAIWHKDDSLKNSPSRSLKVVIDKSGNITATVTRN